MRTIECLCGRTFQPIVGAQKRCVFCQEDGHHRAAPVWEETILFATLRDCGLSVGEHMRLMAEIGTTMERKVAQMRAEEALLAEGRRYNHRAALFPEVSDAVWIEGDVSDLR